MSKFFNKLDECCNGWISTPIIIIFEIIVIYLISNIPFLLATLELSSTPESTGNFLKDFLSMLNAEIQEGQLFTFVCALVAPAIFWSIIEFKKAIVTKVVSLISFLLISLVAYLHNSDASIEYFTNFHLYLLAICIWILAIIAHRTPPDRNKFEKYNEEQQETVNKLIKIRGGGDV